MPSAHAFTAALRIKSPEFQQNVVEDLKFTELIFKQGLIKSSKNYHAETVRYQCYQKAPGATLETILSLSPFSVSQETHSGW